jgi:SAM-dependent methyltransferase
MDDLANSYRAALNKVALARDPDDYEGAIFRLTSHSGALKEVAMKAAFEATFALTRLTPRTILDVGSGRGEHAEVMRWAGHDVTTLDAYFDADIKADFLSHEFDEQFDVVFTSHVLEHQRNVGLFLDKLVSACKPGGLICITVPPEVGHHFLLCHPQQFNAGLLLYHLVLAGVDCRRAKALTYGYNVSVMVENFRHDLPPHASAYETEAAKMFRPVSFSTATKQMARWTISIGCPNSTSSRI